MFNGQTLTDMDKFRVCGITSEGSPQVERDNLSYDEAVKEMNRRKSFFPDTIYFIDVQGDEDKFRVCGVDEDGYPQILASDLSYDEALKEMDSLNDFFPDTIYFIDVQDDDEDDEQEAEPMRRMNGVVDGWEDFFPDYD